MQQLEKIDLSIVIPVYRNADTLETLFGRIRSALDERFAFEVVFVDDACPEGSLAVLESFACRDPRIAVLALPRNEGQHKAVMAGLTCARGDWIVIMDADLQDPPEGVPDMLAEGQQGVDAVFGGRKGMYQSSFRLFCSKVFKGLLHLLIGVPPGAGIFVAMSRRMKDKILSMSGTYPFIVAMIGCAGLPASSVPVRRAVRATGHSAYNFWARLRSACRAFLWVAQWKCRKYFNWIGLGKASPVNYAEALSSTIRASHHIGARFQSTEVSAACNE